MALDIQIAFSLKSEDVVHKCSKFWSNVENVMSLFVCLLFNV